DAGVLEGVDAAADDRHDATRDLHVERAVTADENGLRLALLARDLGEPPRPRDRERGADTVLARRVTGRGHDPAPGSPLRIRADYHRAPPQLGVVALLHRGVEGVHVHVPNNSHSHELSGFT